MKRLYAFWRYQCERCNRKESVEATVVVMSSSNSERIEPYSPPPVGWTWFHNKIYCEICSAVIRKAIGQ